MTKKQRTEVTSNEEDPGVERLLEDLTAVKLMRLADSISILTERAYAQHGLRVTDLRILSFLHGTGSVSVADISRRTLVDKAWISRLVRGLEAKDLVKRTAHPSDTRAALVTLTKKGRQLESLIKPLAFQREEKMLKGVNRDRLFTMLDRIETNIQELVALSESD